MKLSKSLIIPGFLFEKEMIQVANYDVIDIYELSQKTDKEIQEYFSEISSLYDHIVGYSMGGRVLLRYYDCFENTTYIDLAGVHPGGFTDIQRQEAFNFFNEVIYQLETLSEYDFLKKWNQLELFKNDIPIDVKTVIAKRSSEDILQLFRRWPAYNQADYRHLLLKNNIRYLVYGELDTKYKNIYQCLPSRLKNLEVDGKSHRCLTPQLLTKLSRLQSLGGQI